MLVVFAYTRSFLVIPGKGFHLLDCCVVLEYTETHKNWSAAKWTDSAATMLHLLRAMAGYQQNPEVLYIFSKDTKVADQSGLHLFPMMS